MPEYNDGYECRVFDKSGKLKKVIPHNPRPGKDIVNITEDELDTIINGETRQSKFRTKDANEQREGTD